MIMKRITSIFILLFFATTVSFAQEQENEKDSDKGFDTERKGTTAIDVYYGYPHLFYQIFVENKRSGGYRLRNLGPFGVRAEYFVGNHVGFGLDANYSISSVSWESYEMDITGKPTGKLNSNKIEFTRLRILGKFSYHFGPSKDFDMYAGAGLGINQTLFTSYEDGVSSAYTPSNVLLEIATTFPISWRIDFGGRYYFTKNLGVGFETGISGGPFLSLSFCTKF
jgi:hypothetical protein